MGQSSAMNTILIIPMVFMVLISVINFRKINTVSKKVNRVKRRYDALLRARDGDIEDILNQNSTDIMANQERIEELSKALESVETLQAISLQEISLVNYDAFEYLTNKPSYLLCLLDANDNGLIITSIFGREQSTSYIKIIANAECSERLSGEENEALKKALKQNIVVKKKKVDVFEPLKSKIPDKNLKIVFPEGEELRILKAIARLNEERVIVPAILDDEEKIKELAKEENLNIEGVKIINPLTASDFDEKVDKLAERRKGKNTEEQARTMLKDVNYYGTMMLYCDEVDGLVSGVVHSTGDTVKPALQIIKTKPGTKLVSGVVVMIGPNGERYVFSDIAVNIELSEEQLAEVDVVSAETAKLYDVGPKVVFLSLSTKGFAKHPLAEEVANATKIAQEMAPDLPIDGELQFDASIAESVGKQKAPGSNVAGHANVFIFPDLQAGNIGYKIAQRLGKFEAIGPILQGMAKSVSDLSRGCNEEDVHKLALITAAQSL